MNIALIGYGNMGKELELLIANSKEHRIVSISYKNHEDGLDILGIKQADVAIDFTSPEIVMENIEQVVKLGTPLVVGTTGWLDKLPDVKKIIKQYNAAIIYGGNFSIGANIFFQIIAYSSTLFNQFSSYDVYCLEIHHTGKKDSPSGTAKKLADIIMKAIPRKKELQTNKLDRKIREDELHFSSIRGGVNNGEHQITFDSLADTISLTHHAHSRRGFAEGALFAAKFIQNKKGLYQFEDIFTERRSSLDVRRDEIL